VAQDTGGLPELIDALRWRWKLLLLIIVPIVLGSTIYAERLPDQFEGKAVVAVSPKPNGSSSASDIVTVVGPKYVAYITADHTIRRLAPGLGVPIATLEGAVDASLAPDTGNVTITATLPDAVDAARVANAFADDLVGFSTSDSLAEAQPVAPAVVPRGPSGPPRRLLEVAAFIVAVVIAVALAVLTERSRPRMRSWRDIAVVTGYPVVGRLPLSRRIRRVAPGRALSDPKIGAAARSLRTNLERELGGSPHGVVVVASAVKGEGKTTVAGVLATTLARLDRRVLLIDADLRAAGLSKGMRVDANGGLAGLLRGGGDLFARLQPGWTGGLAVLPTATDADAGELLARRFSEVLRRARDSFDVVIVDSPELLAADDAATLATQVDGVLMVVSDGTMAAPVSEAVLALHGLRVRVWGVVANRVRETGGAVSYAPASI
jgi:Mrp family chromosome partitioning ATPase